MYFTTIDNTYKHEQKLLSSQLCIVKCSKVSERCPQDGCEQKGLNYSLLAPCTFRYTTYIVCSGQDLQTL